MEKKLYKSVYNRKVAGVCGGVAEYFNIDPVIVRLGFALFSLTYGSGLLIYIIAALILEDNPNQF